jgi:hypothetical protein
MILSPRRSETSTGIGFAKDERKDSPPRYRATAVSQDCFRILFGGNDKTVVDWSGEIDSNGGSTHI